MDEFLYFIKDFFGAPAILIAIFVFLGNLLIRKTFTDTIIATVKAAAGFFALSAGAALMGSTLSTFTEGFKLLIPGTAAVLPNSDALAGGILAAIPEVATVASLIMFFSIVLNVALARTSKFKYIFLTGHHALFLSVALAIIFNFAGLSFTTDMWYMILAGSFFLAIYMTLTPALSKSFMEPLTKDNKMYIGHGNTLGLFLGGSIGNLVHKIKKGQFKSAEAIKFPKWLNIFSNGTIAVAITMLVLFSVVYIPIWAIYGKDALVANNLFGLEVSIPVRIIIDALTFTAGFEVLVFGINMMVGELSPALEGISLRFIPGAKMGVDVSVGLSYQPTSVLLGFIGSFGAGLLGLGISFGLNAANPTLFPAIIIPGIVVHFFCGGVAATFANIKGGWVAALLAGFANGILISFVPIVFYAMGNLGVLDFNTANGLVASDAGAQAGFHWAESDYLLLAIVGAFIKGTGEVGKWIFLTASLVAYLGLTIHGILFELKDRKQNPQKYLEIKQHLQEIKALAKEEKKQKQLAKTNKKVEEPVLN